jgi:large subunit ribosomal protein L5
VAVNAAPQPEAPQKPRLRERFERDAAPQLMQEFGYHNPLQVPKLDKVVLNIGIGDGSKNPKGLEAAMRDLTTISGQKPLVRKSRKNIASFKLRAGENVGLAVTLRGARMYEFLDRFINAALPRIRDFRGVPTKSFDGRGNYTLGLKEQLIFPEIEYDQIDKVRGLEITVVTTARTDQEARRLLELLGVPFAKS